MIIPPELTFVGVTGRVSLFFGAEETAVKKEGSESGSEEDAGIFPTVPQASWLDISPSSSSDKTCMIPRLLFLRGVSGVG